MDINKMTMKSQEALQTAQNIAVQRGHQEIGTEHLMVALLANETDLIPRLFNNMNIPISTIKSRLDEILARLPRVSGPGIRFQGRQVHFRRKPPHEVGRERHTLHGGYPCPQSGPYTECGQGPYLQRVYLRTVRPSRWNQGARFHH